ncbi:MAG: ParB/RepB/Spo0J family partition protein, partial [Chloroflexi bacterium]|nr:ParB/RepB/Spo0J family partition protein [Chloroflexota bacterium]
MSESVRESTPESQSPRTKQPAGLRPRGPLTAPRATPPPPADAPHGGEATASVRNDDALLDTQCEVITIGHARFYLRYADWLPPLAEDEFDGLTASIREHGIQQPVVAYRLLNNHFDVVDGLHRLKVAQALELDLAQIPLNILDQATSVKEQKALAWSLNADRRHLTKEQRQARAGELRKQGLSYRAIGEQLGVSHEVIRKDVQEATVNELTVDLPERVVSKDGKSRPATAPEPSENEIQIAREFIIDALRKKYTPLARGQLYRDASRIAGASGIKRKAFDAALDAMIEAGSIKEHTNPHGAREYHFADVVDRLEQRASEETTSAPHSLDDIAGRLQKAVDTLADSGVEIVPGPSAPADADELHAIFDHDAITLAGRTDDGAWHRAIEVARKLVAAGIWNGGDRIEFDAYKLHDKLFGVSRVEPTDLVPVDDY